VLFKLPAQQLMEVTHHRTPKHFKTYVVEAAWRDHEAEAHAGRTFSLWAQNHYEPPISTSVPDVLGRMNHNHATAFGNFQENQENINASAVDPGGAQEYQGGA
jgi:hypothetical protein